LIDCCITIVVVRLFDLLLLHHFRLFVQLPLRYVCSCVTRSSLLLSVVVVVVDLLRYCCSLLLLLLLCLLQTLFYLLRWVLLRLVLFVVGLVTFVVCYLFAVWVLLIVVVDFVALITLLLRCCSVVTFIPWLTPVWPCCCTLPVCSLPLLFVSAVYRYAFVIHYTLHDYVTLRCCRYYAFCSILLVVVRFTLLLCCFLVVVDVICCCCCCSMMLLCCSLLHLLLLFVYIVVCYVVVPVPLRLYRLLHCSLFTFWCLPSVTFVVLCVDLLLFLLGCFVVTLRCCYVTFDLRCCCTCLICFVVVSLFRLHVVGILFRYCVTLLFVVVTRCCCCVVVVVDHRCCC